MRGLLGMAGGLALGVAFSQFPEYAQQYSQRLGGAVDELRVITMRFDADAEREGLSRQAALARYAGTNDTFIAGQGRSMQVTFERYVELSAMLERIRGASAMERLALLPDYADSEIGARALEDFQPAVPVTVEGLAYAAGGFVLGYGLSLGLLSLLLLPFRRRRSMAA